MPTTFSFSEKKIAKLEPPARNREYHKDTGFPGLQVCITSAGKKTYYLVKRTDGKPTRHILGTVEELSVDQARKAASAVSGKIATGVNPQAERRAKATEPTLQALWEHWLLYAHGHKKPRSVEEDERNWKLHLSAWANRRLGGIKKADVQAFHSKLGTDSGIYGANRVLALLRAMYNKAEDIGYRGDNPAKGVKVFKEIARDRFLQAAEFEAFFSALNAEPELFRHFFLLALLTGARKSNLLSMCWADVDLAAGYWRIPETKAGVPVVVPLVAPAVSILTARKEICGGSAWVFPGHRRGTHLCNPQKAWARVLTTAKLKNLRTHDLRRSIASYMAIGNVSMTIIGAVLGHRPGSTASAIYARLSMDPRRHAMEAATTTMLAAGKQTRMLTIDVQATEGKSNG